MKKECLIFMFERQQRGIGKALSRMGLRIAVDKMAALGVFTIYLHGMGRIYIRNLFSAA
ncbi:hypothetical protein [Chromobacterium phragmitis]|uniref:N-acetyltransferase domain-containing protein n=1 Tax=Chromobacterium phragmitis TaxID=2202141 RepID=A0ABV0INM4_9NEIS